MATTTSAGCTCKEWRELQPESRKREWAWQVLHRLAHSHGVFSLETFIDLATSPPSAPELSESKAKDMLKVAIDRHWVAPYVNNYMGSLTKRR